MAENDKQAQKMAEQAQKMAEMAEENKKLRFMLGDALKEIGKMRALQAQLPIEVRFKALQQLNKQRT